MRKEPISAIWRKRMDRRRRRRRMIINIPFPLPLLMELARFCTTLDNRILSSVLFSTNSTYHKQNNQQTNLAKMKSALPILFSPQVALQYFLTSQLFHFSLLFFSRVICFLSLTSFMWLLLSEFIYLFFPLRVFSFYGHYSHIFLLFSSALKKKKWISSHLK